MFEDVNRLPPAGLRALEPLTQPALHGSDGAVASLGSAIVVLTSDLYAGPEAAAAGLLEPGMAAEDAREVYARQAARMWAPEQPPAWWAREVATFALPPLDARELDLAAELYLQHDVGAAVRDALRFEFARLRANHPRVRREWAGAFSFDEGVVEHARAFVDAGPAEWRGAGVYSIEACCFPQRASRGGLQLSSRPILTELGRVAAGRDESGLPTRVDETPPPGARRGRPKTGAATASRTSEKRCWSRRSTRA